MKKLSLNKTKITILSKEELVKVQAGGGMSHQRTDPICGPNNLLNPNAIQ
ncbi:hypothetical protein [Aquimarina longa]|nr:hypothetical protein [Aquimarina longa]